MHANLVLLKWLVLAFLGSAALPVAAAVPDLLRDGGAAFERLLEQQETDFETIQAQYETERGRHPDDAGLAMARCDFYWRVWDLEDLAWSSVAPKRHEACLEDLQTRWPDTPEVQLFIVEQGWGEDSDKAAMKLWDASADWPEPLKARLAHRLANADDSFEPGRFAVEAVRLGRSDALPDALAHLAATEGTQAAVALAAVAPPARSNDELNARLRALLKLDDAAAARDHLRNHRTLKLKASPELAARSLIRAGDFPGAAKVIDRIMDRAAEQRSLRLELALASGDAAAAAEHFQFDADEVTASAEQYFRILSGSPLSALRLNLLPVTLGVLATMFAVTLLPLPLLLPVHYRGLARRVAGKASVPTLPGLGLRHAWYATGVALVLAPVAAVAMMLPAHLADVLDENVVESGQLFSIMLWGTVYSLVVMLPMLYWMRMRQWVGPRADWPGLLARVLGCYAAAFVVGMLLGLITMLLNQAGIETATSSFQPSLLQQGRAQYGVVTTFLLVAVLVPVFEEWVFRGVLLAGLSRHLSFGWANTLQAGLFMLVHDDPSRYPFFFVFGLLAGGLVRRYGYLMPAILLHMLNNSVAVSLGLG